MPKVVNLHVEVEKKLGKFRPCLVDLHRVQLQCQRSSSQRASRVGRRRLPQQLRGGRRDIERLCMSYKQLDHWKAQKVERTEPKRTITGTPDWRYFQRRASTLRTIVKAIYTYEMKIHNLKASYISNRWFPFKLLRAQHKDRTWTTSAIVYGHEATTEQQLYWSKMTSTCYPQAIHQGVDEAWPS